jgi:hypothetical protein
MQNPTDQAETSIPTETVINGPTRNRSLSVRRRAAKVTPSRKKARFEEPLPVTTDEAARLLLHLTFRHPPPVADNDDANANANVDPVTDTQSNIGATGRWTLEEDAKLASALTNTCKKKHGKGYRTDWDAVAALVPGRTKIQSLSRWHDSQEHGMNRASARTGKWTEDEDSKLKDAVHTHGGEDWAAIAVLVPGRTKSQCYTRWYYALDPSTDRASGHWGQWTAAEDRKLKDVVKAHSGKDWAAIAVLIPGRAGRHCFDRWHSVLDPNIDQASKQRGKWTADEDSKLKKIVHTHGGKKWDATAALVPGRTKSQCYNRWHIVLDPSIDQTNNRTGKWTESEVVKLKNAVKMHGGEEWAAIAELVPGRTKRQCGDRWKKLRGK